MLYGTCMQSMTAHLWGDLYLHLVIVFWWPEIVLMTLLMHYSRSAIFWLAHSCILHFCPHFQYTWDCLSHFLDEFITDILSGTVSVQQASSDCSINCTKFLLIAYFHFLSECKHHSAVLRDHDVCAAGVPHIVAAGGNDLLLQEDLQSWGAGSGHFVSITLSCVFSYSLTFTGLRGPFKAIVHTQILISWKCTQLSGHPRRRWVCYVIGKDVENVDLLHLLCSEWVPSEWEIKQLIKTS